MNIENIFTLCCIGGYTLSIFCFIFANEQNIVKNNGTLMFVYLNILNVIMSIVLCSYVYHLILYPGLKTILLIIIFNISLVALVLIRDYVATHYCDQVLISNGVLYKLVGSQYLKSLSIPYDCTTISESAIADFPDLTRISFGKNITHFSGDAILNCPSLKTLRFKNPNIVYDKFLEEKYEIIISRI